MHAMIRDWTVDFLAALALAPNVSEACRRARITREGAYKRRRSDPEFAARWDEALEGSTDDLVGECYRRAKEGCEKPVYYKGVACGTIREYSDTLAMFLLKAHRRGTYGDRVEAEHSGELTVRVEYADPELPDDHADALAPAPAPGPGDVLDGDQADGVEARSLARA